MSEPNHQMDFFQEYAGVPRRQMRCLALWQPWASLIAVGLKTVETRSWPAPQAIIGTRIGIHAAKTNHGMLEAQAIPELWESVMESITGKAIAIPFGCLVATAVVEASIPTNCLTADIYGNYAPGRFGWILTDIQALETPIPLRGLQGIFTIDQP